MSKKAYIGVDGVARKVKKGYIGIDEVARKIKKAYVGIGGVARPCWSGSGLEYYGLIDSLNPGRRNPSGTTVGNYAIFAGGYDGSSVTASTDAYDASLTKVSVSVLSSAKQDHNMGAHIGDYAIFGTGLVSGGVASTVDTYSSSLTKGTASSFTTGVTAYNKASVGDYVLFTGGTTNTTQYNYNYVNAYNKSLTKSSPTSLSQNKWNHGGGSIGNYAIFAGGYTGTTNGATIRASAVANAYNTSLTRSIPDSLSAAATYLVSASVGNHLIFYGTSKVAETYDPSLTKGIATSMNVSNSTAWQNAVSIGNLALFVISTYVYTYDESLTVTKFSRNMSYARNFGGSTVLGNFAIFAGNNSRSATVEAFVWNE